MSTPATGKNSNDKRGDQFARELAELIVNKNDVSKRFLKILSHKRRVSLSKNFTGWDFAKAGSKADIIVSFKSNVKPAVISVFSASKADFNHLERKWPKKYSEELHWDNEFTELISLFTGRVSASKSHKKYLTDIESCKGERLIWSNFNSLAQKKIILGLNKTRRRMLTNSFCGSGKITTSSNGIRYIDNVEIIAFYNVGQGGEKSTWSFCVPDNIIESVLTEKVKIQPSETVISLGNSITLQRYGGGAGNGDLSQKAQIQLKVRPKQLFKESIDWTKFDEISDQLTFKYTEDENELLNQTKSKAAKRGLSAELALIDAINSQNPNSEWIVEEVTSQEGYGDFKARKPSNKEKPDVILHKSQDQFLEAQGISIKTYKPDVSFGQASRGTVETYTADLEIPYIVAETLRAFAVEDGDGNRKMLNKASASSQQQLLDFFTKYQRQIVSHILRGKAYAELKADWILFHEAKDDLWIKRVGDCKFWHLYPMEKIIDYCCSKTPSLTKAGNLVLGPGLTLQRKGGDGGAKSANDLQFKLNPKLIHEAISKDLS